MTQWVCPSCGNPFSSEQQPTKCPGCKFAVAAEHGPQFRELETEDLGSADGESFELVDEGGSALAAKTVDASSSSAEDFSKTVDVAATVKAEDVAEEERETCEKTVRATLPDASAEEPLELVEEGGSAQAAKTVDASSSSAENFSQTIDAAATIKESEAEQKRPGEGEQTVRATSPDAGKDEAIELLDKTVGEFEKTLDTSAGQDDAFELIDKTINVAVAKTVDTAGFAENPEYYQTQKTVSKVSEHGTVSSLSEMPKRILNTADDSNQITDYELEKELGKGSFGVVWRARQKALNRTVALKLLHEKGGAAAKRRDQTVVETKEQIRRRTEFLREAQFNGRLDHPNIVPIHELGIGDDGSPFYAMKEIRGISWRDVIHKKSLQENIEILERVADAMSFAHSRGILHCDLKPDNVMLGEFGEVLVVDWGQAIDLAIPETFRPGGSPVYIPPEMAQYFCDTILAKEASASRSLVGQRSDTYLLGAILFEIITGFAPHPCLKGDTITDVLRRAARNEIRDYEEFADDELMQIALHAMGADGRQRYETVSELQGALRQYESRQRSIEARMRAEEDLAAAKAGKDYDAFQKARFGFEEATELWPENLPAQRGLRETRLSFAKLALDNQDFDLGLGQLGETKEAAESELKVQLTKGRQARDRRKKLVGALLLSVAAAVVLGLATNTFLINKNIKTRTAADAAKAAADAARSEADVAVAKAEGAEVRERLAESKAEEFQTQADEAERLAAVAQMDANAAKQAEMNARTQAKAAEQLAVDLKADAADAEAKAKDAQAKADKAKLDLAEAEKKASAALKEADTARDEAIVASQAAGQAREEAKIVSFKNSISNIDRLISAGEYATADGLLQGIENRQWEWGRLSLLTHPEVEPLNTDKIVSQSLSADGRWLAIATSAGVQMLNVAEFELIPVLPDVAVTAVALSSDARQLAVALNVDAKSAADHIKIYELSADPHEGARESNSFRAQSLGVRHLEFSPAGDRLLSVGEPDPAAEGDRTEKGESDLMVWRNDSKVWSRKLFVSGDGKVMTAARFSSDGSRIVTAGDSQIHVLKDDGAKYVHYASFSYAAQGDRPINVAVFADAAGTEVMCGCQDSSIVLFGMKDPASVAKQSGTGQSSQQFVSAATDNLKATAEVLYVFPGHSRAVRSLALARRQHDKETQDDRGIMVSAGDDGTLLRWNLTDGTKEDFRGYTNSIGYCAVTPDGQTILSVSSEIDSSQIRKIDLRKYNDELITLAEPTRPLVSVAESRSKKTIFGSDDGRVYAYASNASPELIANWSASPQWKRHLAAGGKIFSESKENSIYVWDEESGRLEQMIDRLASFKLFDVSRDGKTIVFLRTAADVASQAAQIDVWDVDKRARRLTISGPPQQPLSSLAVSPDGKWVVGGYSGLFVWSTETGNLEFRTKRGVQDPQGTVEKIAFLGNSTKLVGSWNQDWLRVFDVAAGSDVQFDEYRFDDEYQSLVDAELVESEPFVLLKTQRGFEVRMLRGDDVPVTIDEIAGGQQARFSRKDPHVVLVVNRSAESASVVAWDWKSKKQHELAIADALAGGAPHDAKFAINEVEETTAGRFLVQGRGQMIALSPELQFENLRVVPQTACIYAAYVGDDRAITLHGGMDGRIRFWKFGAEQGATQRVAPDGQMAGTYSLCQVSPDERYVLAISESGKNLTVFDSVQDKTIVDFGPATGVLTAVCWSADSTRLLTGAESGDVTLWELAEGDAGKALRKIELVVAAAKENPAPVRAVAMDDEANSILVIGDGAASLHRKVANEWIAIGLPHAGETVAGDISPDGKRAVTASQFGSLTLWNADEIEKTSRRGDVGSSRADAKERALLEFYQHKSAVRFAKFSRDGKSLISAETGAAGALIWPTLWDAARD